MDQITKKFLSKPSFELEYSKSHRSEPIYTYYYIQGQIDNAYNLGHVTRNEKTELYTLNDELYEQNKYSSSAYDN